MDSCRTDSWPPVCDRCTELLTSPGALVFSAPVSSRCVKYHLCATCAEVVIGSFASPAASAPVVFDEADLAELFADTDVVEVVIRDRVTLSVLDACTMNAAQVREAVVDARVPVRSGARASWGEIIAASRPTAKSVLVFDVVCPAEMVHLEPDVLFAASLTASS